MGPTAAKLLKELRRARTSRVADLNAVRELRRWLEPPVQADDDTSLPFDHAAWLETFKLLAPIAQLLLDSQALRKFGARVQAWDEEYMPGGPPRSPVLDSVFTTWWLADVGIGPRRETMLSILADVGTAIGLPAPLRERVLVLARSRMGVYRVTEIGPHRVRLEDLATGRTVEAALPVDLKSRATLWLTRLLPPFHPDRGSWVVWSTPYALEAVDAEPRWRAYIERVAAAGPASERAERIERHFKSTDEPKRWLEYIVEGYFGVTETGGIVLTGLPDEPKTLPHNEAYDPAVAGDPTGQAPPLHRVRLRLRDCARSHEASDTAEEARLLRRALGAPEEPRMVEADRIMLLAYSMYGRLDSSGRTALDRVDEDMTDLSADERAVIASLRAGWFSAFEVVHVRLDEGIEVRDVLRGRKLWIHERAATRQIDLGDLLLGWILVDGETITLDGAICHVPRPLAAPFEARLRERREALAKQHRRLDWKRRAGLLAPYAVPILERLMAEQRPPKLINRDGHPVLFCSARYDVVDDKRVTQTLAEQFVSSGPGTYHWVDGRHLIASFELDGSTLRADCDSQQRLATVKARLRDTLGAALRHRADSVVDPESQALAQRARKQPSAAVAIPPDVRAQLQQMMLEHMRGWLDTPVPALGGKSPREAARSQRGRETVALMLTRQQQMFDKGGGGAAIDLREIWAELGLQPQPGG